MSYLFAPQEVDVSASDGPSTPVVDTASSCRTDGLTTEQVVGHIIEINPTASAAFLAQFTPKSLSLYLEHLLASQEPRGRGATWRRPGDTPAIVCVERTCA